MDYSALINDIVPDCPGVPVPVAIRAIREAVRTFCKDSTAYRKKLGPSDLSYANGVYTITIPTGAQIETVISPIVFDGSYTVYEFSNGTDTYQSANVTPLPGYTLTGQFNVNANRTEVFGASPEWMDVHHPGWESDTSMDTVRFFVMQSTNTFVLTPDSGTDRRANLTVSLVIMPDRTTTTIDDEFGNRWFDTLVAGAKFLLMAMPKKEWSDPALAQFYKEKFDNGTVEASRYIKTGLRNPHADGKKHVRMHYR